MKAAPTGRTTFAINAKEGTMLSAVLIALLATAGEIVENRGGGGGKRYFAITAGRLRHQPPSLALAAAFAPVRIYGPAS
jgi:hypothetical protein